MYIIVCINEGYRRIFMAIEFIFYFFNTLPKNYLKLIINFFMATYTIWCILKTVRKILYYFIYVKEHNFKICVTCVLYLIICVGGKYKEVGQHKLL